MGRILATLPIIFFTLFAVPSAGVQWSGNCYLARGVNAVWLDVNDFGPQALYLRTFPRLAAQADAARGFNTSEPAATSLIASGVLLIVAGFWRRGRQ